MRKTKCLRFYNAALALAVVSALLMTGCTQHREESVRQRISINDGWKFMKYESAEDADNLIYDVRPEITSVNDAKPADSKPTEAEAIEAKDMVLKPWIMPSGNDFINDPAKKFERPDGNPGSDFPFVQGDFDDSNWQSVNLPHDWAIAGPFYEGDNPEVGGGMGRLPSPGVAWYRKDLEISASVAGKSIFLDIDGAMSYAIVWLNGNLVGGWPYGYNTFRLDLTPYINVDGGENQLAIRLDNPNHSARWYPGAGLYRNVWLVKTDPVHVAQWGTYIKTKEVAEHSATVELELKIENDSESTATIDAVTEIYELDAEGNRSEIAVASFDPVKTEVLSGEAAVVETTAKVANPKLWGPPPTQTPNRYVAVTTLFKDHEPIDDYETTFGIRTLEFDPNQGVLVNGELVKIQGVNNHHDLGAIGSAFHTRAAERQLEILAEMGTNAIRMAHNPPAPELLELTDRMGFLVMDEVFDSWERKKTPHDFHLIFPEWYEQDLRSMLRRDRNHPSIIMWSYGNEVGEQYTDEEGAAIGQKLVDIVREEDDRPTTSAMNWAKPFMPFPTVMDVISLNYQGEGIRQDPMFIGTERIRTKPQYDPYHEKFPDKMVLTSESASALSSRGIYLFPVSEKFSAPARDGNGGDSNIGHVSAYELHAVDFGSTAQKVFRAIDKHPFVAGEFVWTGFDYLGEPTPYYDFRSSYNGMIDLAGFKKDRFYQYQAQWRPDYPMVHILPHWNWPERVGEITPIHIFTSGDEVEVFLNGESLGRKKMGEFEYRIRYDEVKYEPGEVKAVAYKDGEVWAEETIVTTGVPSSIVMEADRSEIIADGDDLSYITVEVKDADGNAVPNAVNWINFSIEGPGEIIATDNGDPTDFTPFPSHKRKLFSGKALVIVRSLSGKHGTIKVTAESESLTGTTLSIRAN